VPGLTASQIGGFKSACVVFAFRFAAFVRGLGMRRPGGFPIRQGFRLSWQRFALLFVLFP
jgi:hypothetical protein